MSRRRENNPGGGVAILVDTQYEIFDPCLTPPTGVEAVWSIIKIKNKNRVNRIAVCSLYVSPRSRKKAETCEFLTSSIHMLKSKYDNLKFIIGGDINSLDIKPILDSAPSMKQVVDKPTHGNRILDILITDLFQEFYPPVIKEPLECDEDIPGQPSDHKIVLFMPNNSPINNILPPKKIIRIRRHPQSKLDEFGRFITAHNWSSLLETQNIDEKTKIFHETIRSKYEEIFPESVINISSLDKQWMTPELKSLNRRMKREFWKNRKSFKWRKLNKLFLKGKQEKMRNHYSRTLQEALESDPSKWYRMAQKLGIPGSSRDEISVESLQDLDPPAAANKIASHFARISQSYEPISADKLPSFLPAQPAPVIEEYQVYLELSRMKKTKSTLPIDLPYKLRKEFAPELAVPLTNIFNSCLKEGKYPAMWKYEWVTPIPKIKNPLLEKDLRKISGTSDFSKLFEKFLMKWILDDIGPNLDPAQHGNMKGTGTEHFLVKLVDSIKKHLDDNQSSPVVIGTMLDWSAAFDRQCPNLAIQKFMNIGVRSSILPVLTSYLSGRSMSVKFNGCMSEVFSMPGGGPQGTLLGVIEYIVNSNDNANCVDVKKRFKYVDDLKFLELLRLANRSNSVSRYDVRNHVPSDIGTDFVFIVQTWRLLVWPA